MADLNSKGANGTRPGPLAQLVRATDSLDIGEEMIVEYPYCEVFDSAYLVTNPEGRRSVCLIAETFRTTTSYARYLMSVKMQRFLHKSEHVDHIDEDKTNDSIDNLQILTCQENNEKYAKRKGRLMAVIECPSCSEVFTIRKGHSQAIPANAGKVKFCSSDCKKRFPFHKYSKSELGDISTSSLLDVQRIYR